jgi:multidrug resistance efflux pump
MQSFDNMEGTFFKSRPTFMIRWGLSIFGLIIILVLCIAWFIRYPSIIRCNARITGQNIPREIINRSEGRITAIFVKEGQWVNEGEIIASIQSIAQPDAILKLEKMCDSLASKLMKGEQNTIPGQYPVFQQFSLGLHDALGEIQAPFQQFMQSYINFCSHHGSGFYGQKPRLIKRDVSLLEEQEKWLKQQHGLLMEDVALAAENFDVYKKLSEEKVIAPVEYRGERAKYLSKEMVLPQWESSLLENKARQWEKQKEMLLASEDAQTQYRVFVQSLQTLRAEMANWKLLFLLQAPVSGTFSFSGYFAENQLLKNGTLLGWVSTPHSIWYAEMIIPQYNFGRVALSQTVLLRISAYPQEQFGLLEGTISDIKPIATDSGFLARVSLPAAITNWNKKIDLRQGLTAEADIITENLNLLQQFYQNTLRQIRR